jgi:hypothetical protein
LKALRLVQVSFGDKAWKLLMRLVPASNVQGKQFSQRWLMKNIPNSKVHDRLIAARASLEKLDRQRALSGDPHFGKAAEQSIVWRELFDLELQDFDEQIERICAAARNLSDDLA